MTKKIIFAVVGVIAAYAAFVAYQYYSTQSLSPKSTVAVRINNFKVKVDYGSPSRRGRVIFGVLGKALVPYGKYWRLGANNSTEITFSKKVLFGDKAVTSGTYRMYAIPNEKSWRLVLNSEVGTFGFYEPEKTRDMIKLDVPVKSNPMTEQLSFSFDRFGEDLVMNIMWEEVKVSVPIKMQ